MSIASIVCVDGELDVHDTASAAVKAAIERRRETATARIGVAVGELELGDPLGFAKRLAELAEPGQVLVTDSIRRAAGDDHRFVDLGALSTAGYLDRVHVFELGGSAERTRTVLSIEIVGELFESAEPRIDAEFREYDRRVWSLVAKHGGLIQRSSSGDYLAAFALPIDAFRAAVAIVRDLGGLDARVHTGIDHARMTYVADRWVGSAWQTARRIRSQTFRRVASTMTAVEVLGLEAMPALGLVIEVIEEVVYQGVRNPVGVAQFIVP